jgi:ribosomal protein L37AE/L43A
METEREFYECPVCNSHNTRQDYDYPETIRCCDECGADFIEETGEIILDPGNIQ